MVLSDFVLRLLFVVSLPLRDNGADTDLRFSHYSRLNENETRLEEFRDNDEVLRMKLSQLDMINASRKKYRAKPVELDILASRVANKMCREAAENQYISHWNMAGEKPYHRYAFAGGFDHVAENAFGEWTSGRYKNSPETILDLMIAGHKSFMSERAPADGHKKNIIDKTHNFVGIGFYLSGDQFRYYEEFLDRYLEFKSIPSRVSPGVKTSITFSCPDNSYPYYILIYREEFPKPMKPSELNRTGSYSDFSDEDYLQLTAWEIAKYRNGNDFIIPLAFRKEGLYYIHIYTDNKEITSPTKLSTKGKSSYSGIVIRVQ